MDLTKRITDKYCLEVQEHYTPFHDEILIKILEDAYCAGFREYQLFQEYQAFHASKYCILCVWCKYTEYRRISQLLRLFPYNPIHMGEHVTCFAWYDQTKKEFVPYEPLQVLKRAP